ncbi:MAG: hypothetical protein DKT66_28510 [Candidatus Melainabacteria bacterium]|nr:MAG: hypothetical protein DKT66_28510 [Candidatus Melainabacteria bacterium]
MEKIESHELQSDLSMVGFEKVFVQVEQTEKTEQSDKKTDVHEHIQEFEADSTELVSMAEASRRLKIPYPTLRRQVLAGKIESSLGRDGKPLVRLARHEKPSNIREQKVNKPEPITVQSEHSANIQRLLEVIESERSYSRSLNERLEAANHRNGYLEAQAEGFQEQIKLLTDSQHKRGWWARFSSWFMTGR